jgi:L-2-hydroxyglutarate oxidase LhgO
MTVDFDVIVIGAGVIGLAVAREFAIAGRSVLVAERAQAIGTGTSSRNSEVIHAGVYYDQDSLKAKLCVEGRELLYRYCAESGVEAHAVGKLIIAQSPGEIPKLEALKVRAAQNGVPGLVMLTAEEATSLEPELCCAAALYSPSTGIVDSHGLLLTLLADAEGHGATIALNTAAISGLGSSGQIALRLSGSDGSEVTLVSNLVVNCAGHGAHQIASAISGYGSAHLPARFLAKGSYCNVSGKSPFSRLIYPLPVPGALGIHVTLDLQSRARLGPDIEWVEHEDYSVSESAAGRFAAACEGFWPAVRSRAITPAYAGLRPKIHGPGKASADFVIQTAHDHGVKGLVNLFGIESPGLTASLAIARHVVRHAA